MRLLWFSSEFLFLHPYWPDCPQKHALTNLKPYKTIKKKQSKPWKNVGSKSWHKLLTIAETGQMHKGSCSKGRVNGRRLMYDNENKHIVQAKNHLLGPMGLQEMPLSDWNAHWKVAMEGVQS